MDNQHRKISGYRELSQAEIDLMNEVKALGLVVEPLIQKVKQHLIDQLDPSKEDAQEAVDRHEDATPARWANMAATNFQIALMELTRAVAQPTTF